MKLFNEIHTHTHADIAHSTNLWTTYRIIGLQAFINNTRVTTSHSRVMAQNSSLIAYILTDLPYSTNLFHKALLHSTELQLSVSTKPRLSLTEIGAHDWYFGMVPILRCSGNDYLYI